MEYNCLTMLCYFLLYNKVNQLYVYIYPHIPSLLLFIFFNPVLFTAKDKALFVDHHKGSQARGP